jgi:hypothetical protein
MGSWCDGRRRMENQLKKLPASKLTEPIANQPICFATQHKPAIHLQPCLNANPPFHPTNHANNTQNAMTTYAHAQPSKHNGDETAATRGLTP